MTSGKSSCLHCRVGGGGPSEGPVGELGTPALSLDCKEYLAEGLANTRFSVRNVVAIQVVFEGFGFEVNADMFEEDCNNSVS